MRGKQKTNRDTLQADTEQKYQTEISDLFCCKQNAKRYDFYSDVWKRDIAESHVKFGHKIFRLPIFGSSKLKKNDDSITPKEKFQMFNSHAWGGRLGARSRSSCFFAFFSWPISSDQIDYSHQKDFYTICTIQITLYFFWTEKKLIFNWPFCEFRKKSNSSGR